MKLIRARGDICIYTDQCQQINKTTNNNMKVVSSQRSVKDVSMIEKSLAENEIIVNMKHFPVEIDSRADTCCLGENFMVESFTGQVCKVNGFMDQMTVEDIPIATGITAYDIPGGKTILLVFNQSLYFGPKMNHSLINPNQIRYNHVDVQDNPFKTDGHFGITAGTEDIIEFVTSGSTIMFESRYPTNDELRACERYELTSDVEWDPHRVELPGRKRKVFEILDKDVMDDPSNESVERYVASVIKGEANEVNHRAQYESDKVLGDVSPGLVDDLLHTGSIKRINVVSANEVKSKSRHSKHTPERVAEIWNVGLDRSKQILHNTTQLGVRTSMHPIHKRYRVDHLNLHDNRLAGKWGLDHIESNTKSIRGHTGAIVISNGSFTAVYPKPGKGDEHSTDALKVFITDVGVPEDVKTDMAPSFVGRNTNFQKLVSRKQIKLRHQEAGRKNQIAIVDNEIRELRKQWKILMEKKNVPGRLWCFGIEHIDQLRQLLPRGPDGMTGYQMITGKRPDISELLDFEFYQLVWMHTEGKDLAKPNRELARWLGIARIVGGDMTYWVLPKSCIPVAESTVQHVTVSDMDEPDMKERVEKFNKDMREKIARNTQLVPKTNESMCYLQDEYARPMVNQDMSWAHGDPTAGFGRHEELKEEEDEYDLSNMDNFINSEVLLKVDDIMGPERPTRPKAGVVIGRSKDEQGRPIGTAHDNPYLSSAIYDVLDDDGVIHRLLANQVAENLWSQIDNDGHEIKHAHEICGHKKNGHAVEIDNGYTVDKRGNKIPKTTTAGWMIQCRWADDTTNWVPLKEVKESNPIELAEYAVTARVAEEPAFKWWVSRVLRQRNRCIKKIKKKYWRTETKFGIRLPHSVEEALHLDDLNGNHLWRDAIKKEMAKAQVAYKQVEGNPSPEDVRKNKVDALRGFQEIINHMIFDIKMDFTRKARYVAGGHLTDAPTSLTYSSVVGRDSVKIAFMLAAHNDLELLSCDIGNAYLNAPCREKIWFVGGPETGPENQGKVLTLERALYGLKTSGASWRSMFSKFIINDLKFKPTSADPDVYLRRAKREDGTEYYEMLLVYVDDVLCISEDPMTIMKMIGDRFDIKNNEIIPPKMYLGGGIEKRPVLNGERQKVGDFWTMNSEQYITNMVNIVEDKLKKEGLELKGKNRRCQGIFPTNYKPELDATDECDREHASWYRQIIGMLNLVGSTC